MPTFICTIRDSLGSLRKERRDAADRQSLLALLKRDGVQVLEVRPENRLLAAIGRLYRNRRVSMADIAFAERRLAMMLRNGIDLATALDSMSRQSTNDRLRDVFAEISKGVMSGDALSDCMQRAPEFFTMTAVGLVRAGEESGKIGECLDEVARNGLRDVEMRSRILSAFMYPVIVLVIAVGIVIFFLTVVLPRFMGVFESFDTEIPLPTRILLGVNSVLANGWPVILVALFGGGYLLARYWKTEAGRLRIDGMFLALPLFGRLALLSGLSRVSRTLGSLLRSGIPVDRALAVVADVTDNARLRQVLRNARNAVVSGSTLHEALSASGLMPEMLLQMVNSGEISGSLPAMLEEVGEFYEMETSIAIRNLTTALEPIMLVFMGVVVGAMALAVLLPLFRMTQAFK